MQCPVDQTVLQMTDRQGVEIDYCPQCRGVWLDRGELDKIIARGNAEAVPAGRSRRGHDNDLDNSRRQHKRKGFLSDLFEFGD
jgi:uncharacterized protein